MFKLAQWSFEIYSELIERYYILLLQPISFGILRSDYMLDSKKPQDASGLPDDLSFKQVEINTIASSFGGLSPQVRGLHR